MKSSTATAPPATRLVAAAERIAQVVDDRELAVALSALGDDALLDLLAGTAEAQRALDLVAGPVSAEVARLRARARILGTRPAEGASQRDVAGAEHHR